MSCIGGSVAIKYAGGASSVFILVHDFINILLKIFFLSYILKFFFLYFVIIL